VQKTTTQFHSAIACIFERYIINTKNRAGHFSQNLFNQSLI
jgi:hypothetical protein